MTHLTTSKNRKPGVLSGRISVAGFSAIAAAALMFNAGSAEAGPADIKAIQSKLPAGVYFAPKAGQTPATAEQIADAVLAVLQDVKYKKLVPGNVAGEALKHSTIKDDPTGLKAQLVADKALEGLPAAFRTSPALLSLPNLVGDAAKLASGGKGANPTFTVPSFTQRVLSSSDDAVAAAVRAASNKTAAALILGGYADELNAQENPQEVKDLVSLAVLQTKLTAAAPEVIRVVATKLDDAEVASFVGQIAAAKQVSDKKANSVTIVAGYAKAALAAKPEEAAAITDALLNNVKPLVRSSVEKGIASYAKTVAAVADIEQISMIGAQLAAQVGLNKPGASVGVAAGLAKTLAAAIFSKPVPTSTDGYALTDENGAGKLTIENRIDEIAEVAAYVVGGVFGNNSFINQNGKVAKATVLAIVKGVIAGSKSTSKALKDVNTEFARLETKARFLSDVMGSVALTIQNSDLTNDLKATLTTYLKSQVNAIAGTNGDIRARVNAAIEFALSNSAAALAQLENGNRNNVNGNPLTLAELEAALLDPTTDEHRLIPAETPIANK